MKNILFFSCLFAFSLGLNSAAPTQLQQTRAEIKKTMGLVPSFFDAYPQQALPGAWDEMKGILLNTQTAIPNKYKELIGLAVSAQIPCSYCVYFHTQFATLNGATEEQRKEAIAISALVRHWSTIANGNQLNYDQFIQQVDGILNYTQNPDKKVVDVQGQSPLYQEISMTLGQVPSFMQVFPKSGLQGAWDVMKTIELSNQTSIEPKYKDLIGLGVSAQVPCEYCVYFHTASAKANGATEQEIQEAVAVGALTRHWSTILNGAQTDMAQFRQEVKKVIKHVSKK